MSDMLLECMRMLTEYLRSPVESEQPSLDHSEVQYNPTIRLRSDIVNITIR